MDNKSLIKLLLEGHDKSYLNELNNVKFNKIRETFPEEWTWINNIYQSEIGCLNNRYISALEEAWRKEEELEKRCSELEIQLKVKSPSKLDSYRKFVSSILFYLLFTFIVVVGVLFTLHYINSDSHNAAIGGTMKFFSFVIDFFKIANVNSGGTTP